MRDLPLRSQLMIAFAFLSITTTAISTIAMTALHARDLQSALHGRAERISRRLQSQFEASDATSIHSTAHALFDSYAGAELDGLAIYDQNGALMEGLGRRPERPLPAEESLVTRNGHLTVAADVKYHEGGLAHVYFSFSLKTSRALLYKEILSACAIGAAVALLALIPAAWLSRRIAKHRVM